MSHAARAIGDTVAGRYIVEQFLGESPCGRTYVASESFSGRSLCLKLYHLPVSALLLKTVNFFLKAGALTEIRHENLCAVQDIQEDEGMVYVIREFAEGDNFETWLATTEAETRARTGVQVLWQLGQGLLEMHQSARHLNLHPGNVIVGPLLSRVCDWDPRALAPGEASEPLPVRPAYAGYSAPEVRQGHAGYPSSDIYSLGALAFKLIVGENPPLESNALRSKMSSLDPGLIRFLEKAMAPRPEDRYQHPDHFSDDLWALQQKLFECLSSFEPEKLASTEPLPSLGGTLFGNSPPENRNAPETLNSLSRELSKPPSPPPSAGIRPAGLPKTEPAGEPFRKPQRQPATRSGQEVLQTHYSSLEIPKASGTGNPGDEVSATLFGFQGLGQDKPRHETPLPEKSKSSSTLWLLVGGIAAMLVIAAGILTYFLLQGAEPEIPPARNPKMDQSAPAASRFDDPGDYRPEASPAVVETAPEPPPTLPPPEAIAPPRETAAKREEAADRHPGNAKVSSHRATQILADFRQGAWPASMSECVRMADDFNDLGKLEEANAAYSRSLEYGTNDSRLLIRALGGLAVTSDLLGRKSEAIRAIDRILAIAPDNRFALQYRKGLE